MKVVQVTLRFDGPGGVETTVRETATRLRAAGDEVEVFASDLVDEAGWRRGSGFRPEVDGVPVRRFPARKRLVPGVSLPTMEGLYSALARSGADVIHAHSHRYGHVLQAAAAARRCHIPLVVSTHYHPAHAGEPPLTRGLLRVEDVAFGLSAYRIARALVVESELEARLVRAFSPGDRLRIIPPGIDLTEWQDPDGDRPFAPKLPGGYVLFVGRLASNKGLPVLFEALARIPEPERPPLVLLGPPWGENPALRSAAGRLGIAGSVTWLGSVDDRRAYRATVRGASALVLPSAWEAFGLVVLDAMAAGVPVVASSVGALPEVLDRGRAGRLVPYGDASRLADAIVAVRRDTDVTEAQRAHASDRVRGLDWTSSVARLRGVYAELAA